MRRERKIIKVKRKYSVKSRDKQGFILVVGVIFLTSLLLLAIPFLYQISSERRLSEKSYKTVAAMSLAEAGVERAIWELNHGDISSWDGDSSLRTKTISSFQAAGGDIIGDIDISVQDPGEENPVVESTGRVVFSGSYTIDKTVRVVLKKDIPLLNCALFADNKITFNSNTLFDSYDSRLGEYGGENTHQLGNIATNATYANCIEINGNTEIYGSIASGPDSDPAVTMNIDPGAVIYGELFALSELEEIPTVTPPEGLPDKGSYLLGINSFDTINQSGSYNDFVLMNNSNLRITGNVTLYIKNDFIMGINSILEIAPGASLKIYIEESFTCSGMINNLTRDPTQLLILGTDSFNETMEFKSNSEYFGVFYAPFANVEFNSNYNFYGALVCKEFILNSNAGFHYDEALQVLDIVGDNNNSYYVKSWQQKLSE